MAKNDGGPAFPCMQEVIAFHAQSGTKTRTVDGPYGGMSLRDYFAAAALNGMHARDTFDSGLASPEQRARIAYVDADAMLAERDK